jgi:hypothetical protein
MYGLTKNIAKGCKDLQGGINKVYLFPYAKYSRSQITISGQKVTAFPSTDIYEVHSNASSFNENSEIEGGADFYNQTLTLQFPKTTVQSEIYKFTKALYRAIYIDRLGNIRILGLWNGLDASVTNETGTEKEALNGYRVTFTGKEDNQAYFLDNLNIVSGFDLKIFMDGNTAIFQDGNNYIYN